MSQIGRRWERMTDAVLGFAAAAILFSMMLLTFVDVVLRYLFNMPLRGGFEITEMMLLVLIFAGLPLVSRADEHVTMDFIDRMLTARAAGLLARVVDVLCAAVMFFVAWQVWIKAGKIAAYGDTSDVLRFAIAPFVYFMVAMIGLTAAVHVFKAFVPGQRHASQATL